MLSCDGGFLPTDNANIHIFSQSMLLWNIISSDIRKWELFQKAKKSITIYLSFFYEFLFHVRVAKYRKKINHEKLYCMWHINSMFPLHQDIVHSIVYDETTGKRTVNLDFRKLSGFTPGEDTYMVVIRDVKEFNERFYRACKKAKADFVKHSVVTYYDEYTINPNKRLSPFHKRKRYEKQQEIRYLAYKDTNKALILKLGSLEDIAGIYNVNEFCLVIDDCKIRA